MRRRKNTEPEREGETEKEMLTIPQNKQKVSWFLEGLCTKVKVLLRKLRQRAGRKAEATRNVAEHTGWLECRAIRDGLGIEVWAVMLEFPEQGRHGTGHFPADRCPVCLLASTFPQENLWAPLSSPCTPSPRWKKAVHLTLKAAKEFHWKYLPLSKKLNQLLFEKAISWWNFK